MSAVSKLLRRRYGDFAHHNRKDPLEELLFIICSVQTQESSYRRTFRDLRRTFPRFEELAAAPARKIEKPLVPGGLYRTKSRAIRAICKRIVKLHGRLSLAPLKKLSDDEAEAMLISLPGVGLKVARCVMLYSLGRQVFPVDTHCWRVSRRLGWVRSTKDGVCTAVDMNRLQAKIPPELRFSLHVNLISLGREFCRSGRPRCENCPLGKECRTGRRLQGRCA